LDVTSSSNVSVRVERTNEAWQLRSPVIWPANSIAVERLLEVLQQLRQQGRVEPEEVLAQTNGLAAFGLEPPAAVVSLRQGGRRLELRLGARTPLANLAYLQVVGRDGLYVVDGGFLSLLPASVQDWRDTTLVNLSALDFNRLELRPGTNGFEVARNPTNRLWQMTKPLLTRANNARLESLLQQLRLAQITRFVSDQPEADLEPYGLQPPERELIFGRGTNDLVVLQIGRSPTNDPRQVFVRCSPRGNVVLVSRPAIDPWLASFREFCDRRLMVFDLLSVARLEAKAEEVFAVERQTNDTWRIVAPIAAPADTVLVLETLANLADLVFLEFEREVATDFASYGLAPPLRQYVLKTALTNTPAGPTNLVLAQVDLGNQAGAKLFARRSQENSIVTTIDNGRLPRAAYQLRDRRIWNFSTNQVVSLTVRQRGQTRRLLRTGPMQWTLAQGVPGTVNSFSLEEAAYRLGQLRAERWVARGENQLAQFGIPTADHQVLLEVATANKPQNFTVWFGAKSPSGRPYAAVQCEGQPGPVVFECPLPIYEFVLSDLTLPAGPPSGGP
jgi:hypothetical protein